MALHRLGGVRDLLDGSYTLTATVAALAVAVVVLAVAVVVQTIRLDNIISYYY